MVDTKKKYLDKVVSLLVRDTEIDYERERIRFPFSRSLYTSSFQTVIFSGFQTHPSLTFTKYCENTYGIVGDEIEYVWTKYTNIIKDKIDNER
jgi:hypothetical protein